MGLDTWTITTRLVTLMEKFLAKVLDDKLDARAKQILQDSVDHYPRTPPLVSPHGQHPWMTNKSVPDPEPRQESGFGLWE